MAIMASEDLVTSTYDDWKIAHDNAWYVGIWVWAAWDHIGEAGWGPTPVAATQAQAQAFAFGAVTGHVPYPGSVTTSATSI